MRRIEWMFLRLLQSPCGIRQLIRNFGIAKKLLDVVRSQLRRHGRKITPVVLLPAPTIHGQVQDDPQENRVLRETTASHGKRAGFTPAPPRIRTENHVSETRTPFSSKLHNAWHASAEVTAFWGLFLSTPAWFSRQAIRVKSPIGHDL